MSKRGKYIVIEGGEHAGKTTQVQLLAEKFELFPVREPGGTAIGEQVRSLLLDRDTPTDPATDVFLHSAARSELIRKIVNPKLKQSQHVISDRSWISTAAYQGAMGVPIDQIKFLSQMATGKRYQPDVLIFLSARPDLLIDRAVDTPDYYERMSSDFHNEVYENYVHICVELGGHILDATASVEEVNHKATQIIANALEPKR